MQVTFFMPLQLYLHILSHLFIVIYGCHIRFLLLMVVSIFLSIVDDRTRAIWTIPLPTKQHVSQTLKDFSSYVTNQFNCTVKNIRTDNRGKFFNADLASFFTSSGIIHQTTCPYIYSPTEWESRKKT